MFRNHLVAIGACYIDTILDVPYYPQEDEKLRSTSLTKRRGGNCPNTLEVLQQLVAINGHQFRKSVAGPAGESVDSREDVLADTTNHANGRNDGSNETMIETNESALQALRYSESTQTSSVEQNGENAQEELTVHLTLISTFPSQNSTATRWIVDSFDEAIEPTTAGDGVQQPRKKSKIDFSHCLYRDDHDEPASSYIISSSQSNSRTIVNYNGLSEMTFQEFKTITERLFSSPQRATSAKDKNPSLSDAQPELWHFHFEGRIPATTLQCIRLLRDHKYFQDPAHARVLRISVEVEKPGREGLQTLADEADVVFYSKSWAQAAGYSSPEDCVQDQHSRSNSIVDRRDRDKTWICTWGAEGARAINLIQTSNPAMQRSLPIVEVLKSSAFHGAKGRAVVDTTGAGDTFIAGALFGMICRSKVWSVQQILDFANRLAGEKVLQHGFNRLGEVMKDFLDQSSSP